MRISSSHLKDSPDQSAILMFSYLKIQIKNEGYETVFCQFNEVQYNNLLHSCMSFELIELTSTVRAVLENIKP